MNDESVIKAMSALAQSCRLRIFRSVVSAGERGMTPQSLGEILDVPSSTLSFHLKELLAAGLLSQERVGRSLLYRARLALMQEVMAYLTTHCCYAKCCGNDAVLTTGNGAI